MLLYDNVPGCVTMGYEPNATVGISIPVISIPHDLGQRLNAAAAAASASGGSIVQPTAAMQGIDVPLVDASALLLWLLAVGTLIAGSVWSGVDYVAGRKAAAADQSPLLRPAPGAKPPPDTMDLSPRAALGFVVVASAMLLLMYFALNRVFFYVLMVLFCLAAVQSQTALYGAALGRVLPGGLRSREVQVPLLGPCPLTALLALPAAAAVSVVWAVERNAPWAWVLQDVQGIALMVLVLRALRVPSLKVACILLPACLAYDVFWVFVQPLLWGGGESIMVHVAEGGSSGEFLPMLLRVPRLGYGGLGGYSLLGFGDVILPGLLVAYTRRVDLDLSLLPYNSYFPYTVLSYGAGLVLTYAALAYSWFGDQGQPALLYLVPCTLAAVLGLAAGRGHFGTLWRGAARASAGSGVTQGSLRWPDHDSDAGEAACALEGGLRGSQAGGTGGGGAVLGYGDVEAGRGGGGGSGHTAPAGAVASARRSDSERTHLLARSRSPSVGPR